MPEADGRLRLNSWKEIGQFLNVSEKTARRYETGRGLPVHRIPGVGKSSVFAWQDELELWLRGDTAATEEVATALRPAPGHRVAISVFALLLVSGVTLLLLRTSWNRPFKLVASGPERLTHSPGSKLPPLSTDDHHVYYQEFDGARFRMMRTSLTARPETVIIDTPLKSPDPGVVAADGSAMLLRDLSQGPGGEDKPLFLQPLPRGEPKRLGEILTYDSAWVPDDKHIVFGRIRAVYEANRDGTAIRKLFDVPGRAHWFRWSPDGRTLRFTVYDSSKSFRSIWQTTSSYDAPRGLILRQDTAGQECCGTWSSDGATYFYQATVNGFYQVFARPERSGFLGLGGGSGATQLTAGAVNYRSPVPLSGGHRLLMLSQTQKSELVQWESAGRRWLPALDGVPTASAAWSRDGAWLAYTRLPERTLWRCRMPGCSEPVQLTLPPARIMMPQWSPDGNQIACMAATTGNNWRASLIAATGGNLSPLIEGAAAEADPTWSPSGREIAFGSLPNPDRGAESAIQVLDLHTRSTRTIRGSQGYNTPSWSRDGRFLAAVKWGTLELGLYEFSTGKWQSFAGTKAGYLNWAADGSTLYFLSVNSGVSEVRALTVLDMKHSPVAPLTGLRRPTFSFGTWIGLGPANTVVALRDLSTEDLLSWRFEER